MTQQARSTGGIVHSWRTIIFQSTIVDKYLLTVQRNCCVIKIKCIGQLSYLSQEYNNDTAINLFQLNIKHILVYRCCLNPPHVCVCPKPCRVWISNAYYRAFILFKLWEGVICLVDIAEIFDHDSLNMQKYVLKEIQDQINKNIGFSRNLVAMAVSTSLTIYI